MSSKPKMIILVGPSGVGKSTLLDMALLDFPNLRDIITFTTRDMRQGEKEGAPYFFVNKDRFRQLIKEDFFMEWAEVHGNLYGSPHSQVSENFAKQLSVIMDVDVQGAKAIKAKYPHALSIFIHPPSIDALRKRLAGRDQGKTKDLDVRMQNALKEIQMADQFDMQLTNDNLATTYAALKKIIEDLLKNR